MILEGFACPDKLVVFQSKRLSPPRFKPVAGPVPIKAAISGEIEEIARRTYLSTDFRYSRRSSYAEVSLSDINSRFIPPAFPPRNQVEAIDYADSLGLPVYYLLYAPPSIARLGTVGVRVLQSTTLHASLTAAPASGKSKATKPLANAGHIMAQSAERIEDFIVGATLCRGGLIFGHAPQRTVSGLGAILGRPRATLTITGDEPEKAIEDRPREF